MNKELNKILSDMESRKEKYVFIEEIPALTSLGLNTVEDLKNKLSIKERRKITDDEVWERIKDKEIETSNIIDMYKHIK